jgi:hypothetical protein
MIEMPGCVGSSLRDVLETAGEKKKEETSS